MHLLPGLCFAHLARHDGSMTDATLPPAPPDPQLRLRILFGPGAMMGPGKADLLQGIADAGSIAGAGRALGMSYKRAWALVEVMNGIFASPLVVSNRGGAAGGGATLTAEGVRVLALYRALEGHVVAAGAEELAALVAMLRPVSDMSGGK